MIWRATYLKGRNFIPGETKIVSADQVDSMSARWIKQWWSVVIDKPDLMVVIWDDPSNWTLGTVFNLFIIYTRSDE